MQQAAKLLADKVLKAHFSLLSKLQDIKKNTSHFFLKIFDTLIMPIPTYSSEIRISDFKIDLFDNSSLKKKFILEIANIYLV